MSPAMPFCFEASSATVAHDDRIVIAVHSPDGGTLLFNATADAAVALGRSILSAVGSAARSAREERERPTPAAGIPSVSRELDPERLLQAAYIRAATCHGQVQLAGSGADRQPPSLGGAVGPFCDLPAQPASAKNHAASRPGNRPKQSGRRAVRDARQKRKVLRDAVFETMDAPVKVPLPPQTAKGAAMVSSGAATASLVPESSERALFDLMKIGAKKRRHPDQRHLT